MKSESRIYIETLLNEHRKELQDIADQFKIYYVVLEDFPSRVGISSDPDEEIVESINYWYDEALIFTRDRQFIFERSRHFRQNELASSTTGLFTIDVPCNEGFRYVDFTHILNTFLAEIAIDARRKYE